MLRMCKECEGIVITVDYNEGFGGFKKQYYYYNQQLSNMTFTAIISNITHLTVLLPVIKPINAANTIHNAAKYRGNNSINANITVINIILYTV